MEITGISGSSVNGVFDKLELNNLAARTTQSNVLYLGADKQTYSGAVSLPDPYTLDQLNLRLLTFENNPPFNGFKFTSTGDVFKGYDMNAINIQFLGCNNPIDMVFDATLNSDTCIVNLIFSTTLANPPTYTKTTGSGVLASTGNIIPANFVPDVFQNGGFWSCLIPAFVNGSLTSVMLKIIRSNTPAADGTLEINKLGTANGQFALNDTIQFLNTGISYINKF
jgi:hypothetical protein